MAEIISFAKNSPIKISKIIPVQSVDGERITKLDKFESVSTTLELNSPRISSREKTQDGSTSKNPEIPNQQLEERKPRKDHFGNTITKGSKVHKISFKKNISTTYLVQNLKKYPAYYGHHHVVSCCCIIM